MPIKKAKPVPAPYPLNSFPSDFSERLAKKILVLLATKLENANISGAEWEEIFAGSIDGTRCPSNAGLRDVYKDTCCWSAKTVAATCKNIQKQKNVRLISGRKNTGIAYDIAVTTSMDANEVGPKVLQLWNDTVLDARSQHNYVRQVVLIRSKDKKEYIVFETELTTFEADEYTFKWNKKNNLEGYQKTDNKHIFTFQPEGKQFTIIEDIPENHVLIRLKKLPTPLTEEQILESIGYSEDTKTEWIYG